MSADGPELDTALEARFGRQLRVAQLGVAGQRRLLGGRVAILGCGALGASQADILARAGVGMLRLIDRDIVELSNLHRQRLYDTRDAIDARPKAVAAAERLSQVVDARVVLEPRIADVTPRNIAALIDGVDLVLDGTDNFETRFLLDEACHAAGLPWVHAAVVGAAGQVMVIRRDGPCYTCFQRTPPPRGSYDTCDTAGVLGPVVEQVAAAAALEAIKLLTGQPEACVDGLSLIDGWGGGRHALRVRARPDCTTCRGDYRWLRADAPREAASLCGRDAVQIPARPEGCDLSALATRLAGLGPTRLRDGVLRFSAPEAELLIFDDGRAIIRGVDSTERGRSLYARYVG